MFDLDDMEIPGLTLLPPKRRPDPPPPVEAPKQQVAQSTSIQTPAIIPAAIPKPVPAIIVPVAPTSEPVQPVLGPSVHIKPKQEVAESAALPVMDQPASASTSAATTPTIPVPAPQPSLAVPSLKFRVRMSGFTVAPARQANAKLQLNGDLDAMMRDWTPEEKASHRRIVKFERSSKENLIEVSFRPLPQAEYKTGDLVINCVSRTDEGSGFFHTSTDIMQLLEGITGTPLEVDVMKRLRAHLRQLPSSMLNRGDKVHTHLMQMGEPAPRKTDQSLKTYPFHTLKAALHLLIEKSFCGPRPITGRTPPPKRAKRAASPTSENVARSLLPPRTPRESTQAVSQESAGRPSRSAQQASQKKYNEVNSESELSELSHSEVTDNAPPPMKRQRTRSRSSSMSSVDSAKQFEALAEFANSITLETWLNNQSAGLGTSTAGLLKQHGLHSHSQLLRFQQASWWLEFMDLKLAGKGLSELDEFLLRKTVLTALS